MADSANGPVVYTERLDRAITVRQRSIHVKLIDGLGRVGDALAVELSEALRLAYEEGLRDGYLQGKRKDTE